MTLPSYQCTLRDDHTSQCVAQTCNLAHDTFTRSPARPFFSVPSASSSPSMTSATSATAIAPERLVRSLLGGVNPGLSVQGVEAVPSARLQLLYNVNVSEGPSLLLALPPPAVMRLLRSERSSIGSEAAILKWLSDLSSNNPNPKVKPSSKDIMSVNNISVEDSPNGQRAAKSLSRYLPILVKHESMSGALAVEYNLSRPPRGVAISSLSSPLTHRERRRVDFQAGQLLRCISLQTSPTRKFGIAADVLSVPPSTATARRLEGTLCASRGADCWSVAFHSLLESVLRDGEDLSIMISYGAIRRHFHRFEHLLDAVTKPRLVVVDAAEDTNTLVLRSPEPVKKVPSVPGNAVGKGSSSKTSRGAGRAGTKKTRSEERERYEDGTDSESGGDYTRSSDSQAKAHIEVTGLRQWTNCLFGDPLMATVFSKHPTRDFWHGFDRPLPGDQEPAAGGDVVEDEASAHVRLLLYECYHAVAAVVKEFYRPQADSSNRELAARKQLGGVLARLDELDDGGVARSRRRRPSGEVSPAKRPKSGDEDDGEDDGFY